MMCLPTERFVVRARSARTPQDSTTAARARRKANASFTNIQYMTQPTADAAVIWLHGDEETGKSWFKLEEALGLRLPWTRWYFPDAPPSNGKSSRKSWFPGFEFPIMDATNEPAGVDKAVSAVHAMIAEVENKEGINASRIVLGGFGPGAALAMLAGRTYSKRLGGVAMISGWYMRPQVVSSAGVTGLPVLLCHGEEDDDVPFELFEEATRRLRKQGCEVKPYGYERFAHRTAPRSSRCSPRPRISSPPAYCPR